MGKGGEADGTVFMRTHVHFTETGPEIRFKQTLLKTAVSPEKNLHHVVTTSPILTSASGLKFAVTK